MRARTELRTLVCVLTVLLFPRPEVSADACEDALEADAAVFASACTEAALRDPYRFAWLLLARICDLEAAEPKACEWQGWATFADTFPAAPIPDRSKPQWPGAGRRYPPVSVTDCTVGGEARPRHYKSMDSDRPADPCEEIYDFRFNQEAFDYIVGKGLWYREGVASFWQEEEPVDFPESAVALQAGWKRIDESQKKDYHWVVSRDDEGEPLL
ncbi:MAG: hypothetical protein KDD47_19375, partial [Acidobacteria bacterium]|nr:hypothetical protein [Acidobacteriota bacterium]